MSAPSRSAKRHQPGTILIVRSVNLPVWGQAFGGGAFAALLAYGATPVAIQAARRFAFYDIPQAQGYKGHARPTPYLGGAAVVAAFTVAALVGAGHLTHTLPLLCGAVILLAVGTIDDRRQVSPGLRVLIEVVIGVLVSLDGWGWRIGAGPVVDAALTAVWVVGVVNAFNLFDNMDGQASTMAIVVAAGAGVLAVILGEVWLAVGCAALCGACVGFLPHNLSSPARIFLGDGGSMPIGFAAAMLTATVARHAEPSALSLLVGFMLVGVPVLDTTLVIISRRRRGVSFLTGGRDHLTHRVRGKLGTPRRVALTLGTAQAIISAAVVAASQASSAVLIYIVLTFVVCAATAIIALEDVLADAAPAASSAISSTARAERRLFGRIPWPDVGLAAIGLAAGLSPLFSAYYDVGVWVPMGIVMTVAATMALVARPPRYRRTAVVALGTVAAIGLWSLLSVVWADQDYLARNFGNLWLTYAAALLLIVALLAAGGRPRTLLIAVGVGLVAVAISIVVRLLGSDPGTLFDGGRLNSPLGYINGEGCAFAMGAWLTFTLVERRNPLVAGLGAGLTVCMAALALLTQSRGAAIATFAAIVFALAVVPGFRRRVIALALTAAAVAVAAPAVVHVYAVSARGVTAGSAHHAMHVTLAAAVGVAVVWAAVVAATNALDRPGTSTRPLLRQVATALAVVLIAIPVVAAVVRRHSLETRARSQWNAFVHLSTTGSRSAIQTRLLSGAGNRYDYWRVAWHTFESHPVIGVGAGNYVNSYYLHRRTQEAIENPHSIELQLLSELGVIGILLLALLVGALVVGVVRMRRMARESREARGLLVAAGATVVVWLVDTSGDWMHLLPGLSAVALCGIAVICQSGTAELVPGAATATGHTPDTTGRRLPVLASAAAAVLAMAIGGASLVRSGLSRHYLDQARAALPTHPATAISSARKALRIDDGNLNAYYVEAAGEARFDHAAAARATLLRAAGAAPDAFVTWVLLGDLETRAGKAGAAHRYYERALALDPREPGLAALARKS